MTGRWLAGCAARPDSGMAAGAATSHRPGVHNSASSFMGSAPHHAFGCLQHHLLYCYTPANPSTVRWKSDSSEMHCNEAIIQTYLETCMQVCFHAEHVLMSMFTSAVRKIHTISSARMWQISGRCARTASSCASRSCIHTAGPIL